MGEPTTRHGEFSAMETEVSTDATGTDTATDTDQQQTTETDAAGKDLAAEVEKWKALSRKHEGVAKANADKAKAFDEATEAQKSEQQKLADAAARAEAEAEAATTKAELAAMKAAVKHGLSEDDLELLGTHGTPEEIETRAEKLATRLKAADEAKGKGKPDFGGGDRGGNVGSTDEIAVLDAEISEAVSGGKFQQAIALRQMRSALIAAKKS